MALRNWFMDIQDSAANKRHHVRVKALNLIRVGKEGEQEGKVVLNISDLSECGMGFRTHLKMDRDRIYPVVLHTPGGDIQAKVKVCWSEWIGGRYKAYEVGVEFVSMNKVDASFLRNMVSER